MENTNPIKPKNYKRSIVLFLCFGFFVFLFRDGSLSITEDQQWFALAGQSVGQLITITGISGILGGLLALILRNKILFYKYAYRFMWLTGLILFGGLDIGQ